MRLSELEPQLLKVDRSPGNWTIRKEDGSNEEVSGLQTYLVSVETIEEADGISFLCPLCYKNNNGSIGTHRINCWKPRMPQADHLTGPGRWELVGTNFEDMSLVSNPTSVQVLGGCNAHFTVSNGNIIWN